jgi:hypothetical protein
MKRFAWLCALVAASCLSPAMAAAPDGPASSISVYAGGAFMREYCDGYYSRSDTYSGAELGADARIVLPSGFLIDLSAEHARVSDYGDAFLEQQLTAGLGYEGRIGRRASWYAEAFYQFYRLGEDFDGCSYSCNGWYRANGGGVKGGLTWPFAGRFFAAVNLRVSYLSGEDSDVDLVQAKLDGSVGYMIADNFSVAIGASSQAMEQTNNYNNYNYNYNNRYGYYYDHSNDTLSHTSVFLKLAVHF